MQELARPVVELVIEGGRRPALRQALRELWAFREVVMAFAERDVRLRYKQAVLGVAWAVIQPLAFLAIFVIIFGRVTGISGGAVGYPAFALSALVPWLFLQTAISFGAQALLLDGALLRKVYFAREAPVLGAVLSAGLDFTIGLGLLLLLSPSLHIRIAWVFLLAVPLWVLLVVLASGVAMGLGALNVYYRDFRHALPLLLQLWMFASPVAYPLAAVPDQWRTLYLLANPAAGILDGFRRVLAQGHTPDPTLLGISAAGVGAVACLGYLLFKTLEPGLADAI